MNFRKSWKKSQKSILKTMIYQLFGLTQTISHWWVSQYWKSLTTGISWRIWKTGGSEVWTRLKSLAKSHFELNELSKCFILDAWILGKNIWSRFEGAKYWCCKRHWRRLSLGKCLNQNMTHILWLINYESWYLSFHRHHLKIFEELLVTKTLSEV